MALAAVASSEPFPDRRRNAGGRPKGARRRPFTWQEFDAIAKAHNGRRNLTLSQLSDLCGIPKQKLIDISPKHLDARKVRSSRSGEAWMEVYLVTYQEARRFLRDLRLID